MNASAIFAFFRPSSALRSGAEAHFHLSLLALLSLAALRPSFRMALARWASHRRASQTAKLGCNSKSVTAIIWPSSIALKGMRRRPDWRYYPPSISTKSATVVVSDIGNSLPMSKVDRDGLLGSSGSRWETAEVVGTLLRLPIPSRGYECGHSRGGRARKRPTSASAFSLFVRLGLHGHYDRCDRTAPLPLTPGAQT